MKSQFPSPLVLHIPHASTQIPDRERGNFCLPDLQGELMKMTDLYTDELFDGPHDAVRFPVSRLLCDPERFRDDAQEGMARIGMGAVYTSSSSGKLLRRITEEERERILKRYYDPHHRALSALVDEKLRAGGKCLILDGHSFPAFPLPYEQDQSPVRPDFCIGTDEYHTPRALVEAAGDLIEAWGFSVEENRPFSGALVPMRFYRREPRVHSLMIEINRGLYLTRDGKRSTDFSRVRALIRELEEALSALEERSGRTE